MIKELKNAIIVLVLAIFCVFPSSIFAATDSTSRTFIISIGEKESSAIERMVDQKIIKNKRFFDFALDRLKLHKKIREGGYKLDSKMNDLQVLVSFIKGPYMEWVVIPEGFRKEQIVERLADRLGWNDEQKNEWISVTTVSDPEYVEGVYFPDTYLLPKNESGEEIAKRFINRFNEKFGSYLPGFAEKNIKWTTALKVASLVQREAASKEDMPLVAGIIWNRLEQDMKLDIDATIQYAADTRNHFDCNKCKDNDSEASRNGLCYKSSLFDCDVTYRGGDDWWGKVNVDDKKIDSPYNTYTNKGLPPYPISNPGIDAIEATLIPIETDCLYYLHDSNHSIHCSKTYEDHLKNISLYLKRALS